MLKFPNVDVGGGWLIFGLPPSDVAVHPSDRHDLHEFYLMCDDVEALMETMKQQGFACSPVQDEGWGLLTLVALPGGGKLGIYRTTSRTSASQTALSLHHLPIFQPQKTVGHADDLQHAL